MQIGFIGLGIMGMPMARHLIRAGLSLTVWSHTAAKAEELGREGATVAASPASLAAKCDLIFIIVGNTEQMREVAVGREGLLTGIREGAVVVDCSTVAPAASRKVAAQFAACGAQFLDAPCTGSKAGAQAGNLTFMVGGDRGTFDRICEYFRPMSKDMKLYYVGGNGMGLHAKLSQNLVLALTYQGMCEAFVLAAKAGIAPELMYDIIQNSAARAGVIEYKKNAVFSGNWDTNFSLKWMHKDMGLILDTGRELGVPLPALAVAHELFGASVARGHGDDDYASAITLIEDWAGTQVRGRN
jgi:3-hydroxyisobutyrate dehydrogenase/2-hydroxy-3-oxopropionate reductase